LPPLAPTAPGKPIFCGKKRMIHLTCKDLNRNAVESESTRTPRQKIFNRKSTPIDANYGSKNWRSLASIGG
jgi:hypothetical protein